jgi:BMFP domain-containing protein YqiC
MMKQLLSTAPASEPRAESELDILRKRVVELEARLEKPSREKPRSRRKR